MPEALKNFYSPSLVRKLAREIGRIHPEFPERAFIKSATDGLQNFELMDRARHISVALANHLPPEYPEALEILLASLGPEHKTDELLGAGMAPFFYLPHLLFIVDRGLEEFDLSLLAQYEITKRFSAEGSIRAFIAKDPERVFARFRLWVRDEHAHVRRLVSEGTRLRLPWAERVRWLDAHPERVLELLEFLKDDPSSMVRRSVANNLNDLGKVHPALLVKTCARWLRGASPDRRALVEHALRSAVKRGESGALRLLGYGAKPAVSLEQVRFHPRRVAIGESVSMRFALKNETDSEQRLLVDVVVHFVKARRGTGAKTFKLRRVTLAPNSSETFETRFSLAVHTTRVPRPGDHRVEVLVNGARFPAGSFLVVTEKA